MCLIRKIEYLYLITRNALIIINGRKDFKFWNTKK